MPTRFYFVFLLLAAHANADVPKTLLCRDSDGTGVRFKPREFEPGADAAHHFWMIRSTAPRARVAVTRTLDAAGTARFSDARGSVVAADSRSSSALRRGARPSDLQCKEVVE